MVCTCSPRAGEAMMVAPWASLVRLALGRMETVWGETDLFQGTDPYPYGDLPSSPRTIGPQKRTGVEHWQIETLGLRRSCHLHTRFLSRKGQLSASRLSKLLPYQTSAGEVLELHLKPPSWCCQWQRLRSYTERVACVVFSGFPGTCLERTKRKFCCGVKVPLKG